MATLVDETMESYVYPSYNPYSYRYQPPPKGKGGAGGPPWRPRGGGGGGGGYFSGYGGEGGAAAMAAAAAAAEYFDNYQRAQLKAILSQVNPNLTPRLRKANTKEVGVQVNPRQDASVQCSLGPRPLLLRRRAAAGGSAEHHEHGSSVSGAAARGVRFPRTIAVYSPVASRRLLTTFEEEEEEDEEQQQQQPEPPPSRGVVEPGAGEKPPQPQPQPQPAGEAGAAEAEQDKGQPQPQAAQQPREQAVEEEPGKQAAESGAPQVAAPPQDEGGQPGKARVRFQFLEQKYGYYHCKDCNIRWESAYVWCVQGTNKVYFRQFCRTCQKSYNPYRVEDITCQVSNDF